ncbi:MAG: cell wall hydrolase [Acetobacteraceae bacterium]
MERRAARLILVAAGVAMAWHAKPARAGEGAGVPGSPTRAAAVVVPPRATPSGVLTGDPAPPLAPGPEHPRIEVSLTPEDQEAMGRVAFAEAGNQGAEGLAGVIFTILNRLHGGRWGASVAAVVDAPGQFEPVMRAGGTWTKLPALTPAQTVEYETILHLILEGRVPDPTNGALYFQNPAIVAERAAAGRVPAALVNFGGEKPSAVIRGQAFYRRIAPGLAAGARATRPVSRNLFAEGDNRRLIAPAQGEGATPAGLFFSAGQNSPSSAPLSASPAAFTGPPAPSPARSPARPAGSLPGAQEAPAP